MAGGRLRRSSGDLWAVCSARGADTHATTDMPHGHASSNEHHKPIARLTKRTGVPALLILSVCVPCLYRVPRPPGTSKSEFFCERTTL